MQSQEEIEKQDSDANETKKGRYKDPNYMKKFMRETRKIEAENRADYKRVKKWLIDLFEIIYTRVDIFMQSADAAGKMVTDAELAVLEAIDGYKDAGLLVPVPTKEVRVMKKKGGKNTDVS